MKTQTIATMSLGFLSGLCLPTAAFGQNADTPATAASTADPAQSGIDDIVVTAQRRSENLQKSSLSISVISADQIGREGIARTEDIAKISPGVQISAAGPTPQIYIRGVGDPGTTAVTNPAIALNIGGVYWARPSAAGTAFYDLDRIEVLKGPQGTLYGRNASGGAVNILPTRPRLGAVEGLVNIEAGNYEAVSSDGAVNLPIGATAALRASYQIRQRDGYLSDGSSDDVRQAARLQLLFEPGDRFSLLLLGAYAHQGGVGNGFALYDPAGNPAGTPPRPAIGKFDPWTSITDPRGAAISATGFPAPILLPGNADNLYQDNDYWNFQAEMNADLGFATLTLIPSYQYAKLDFRVFPALDYQTVDGAGLGKPESSKAYSGEARLANESDRFKWVVGLFYYNEKQQANASLNNGFIQSISYSADIDTESVAAFGQASFSLTDSLRVIGGLRYTDDTRTLDGIRVSNLPVPGSSPNAIRGRAKSDSTDYRIGFEFDVADRSMLYGSYATGYKSGGLSAAIAAPFLPETVESYTAGIRNRFLDNRIQLNIEGFYLKYDDQQVQVIGPDDVGVLAGLIRNAGKSTSYGVEADVVAKLTGNDTLSASATYNHTEYDSFVYQTPLVFVAPGSTGCAVTPTGAIGVAGPVGQVDCSGRELPRAPKWAGNVGYAHVFDLGPDGSVTFNGDMQFASSREGTTDYIANTRLPAYQLFNASLTYALASDALSLTAFVRNIGDEAVYLGGYQSSFTPSFVGMAIAPPRTYGLRLSYRY